MLMLKNRLWLLVLLLILTTLACSLTGADDDEADESPTVELAPPEAIGGDPPSVIINSPPNNSEVSIGTDVLVYSIAQDDVGITRVELLQDGQLINTVTSPDPVGQVELSVLQSWIPAETGTVTLEVVPYRGDVRGESASVTLQVREDATGLQSPIPTLTFAVPAATVDLTCRGRINLGPLNVRAEPNDRADILTTVTAGEVIPLIGRTGGNEYWEINIRGMRGWINAVYTTTLGDCRTLPVTGEVALVPSDTPTATLTLTPSITPSRTLDPRTCRAQILNDNLSVLIAPRSDATAVTTVSLNSEWLLFQRTPDSIWWQINVGGVLGWVRIDNIALLGECGSILVASATPEPNQSPVIGVISPQSLDIGETRSVRITANDPDDEEVTLLVTSSDPSVVSAQIESQTSLLLVAGQQTGLATVTVAAQDNDGAQVQTVFAVSVVEPQAPNNPPVISPISDLSISITESVTVPLGVIDPERSTPTLLAMIEDQSVVDIEFEGITAIQITPLAEGRTDVTVVANDNEGGSARIVFRVTVFIPTETPTVTLTPTSTDTATSTNTLTATLTETPIETATFTLTSTESPTQTLTETATETLTVTDTSTPTETITITDTATMTASVTESATMTATHTETQTPSATSTVTFTLSATLTETPTQTSSATLTVTETQTETQTETPSTTASVTRTPSETNTPSDTATSTETPTNTLTSTASATITLTPSDTPTETNTPTETATPSATASVTRTPSETLTPTDTATITLTPSATATVTLTRLRP